MADTTQGDTTVLDLGLLAPALIALIAGLLIHSFIIGVNVSDWWRGRSVTPVDHIVTALGISRICAQSAVTVDLFLSYLYPHVILVNFPIVYLFFKYNNMWLTSLLSIVLCLKISNLHTRLFLYLRRMILHRTGRLIGASILISTVNCLLYSVLVITEVIVEKPNHITADNLLTNCTPRNLLYNYIVGDLIPLVFYYISSVLLFFSLYHHTTRMKRSSNLSINLETYYSVMKLVSFTFIYKTIYFILSFASFFYFYFICVILAPINIVMGFLPVLHSSYLIYRTTRLRNQTSEVLHNVMDFLFQRKDTEPDVE